MTTFEERTAQVLAEHAVTHSSTAGQDKCASCGPLTAEHSTPYLGVKDRERAHQAAMLAAALGERPVAVDVLYRNATHAIDHENAGLCPDGPSDPNRDPECAVCRALVALAAAQSGEQPAAEAAPEPDDPWAGRPVAAEWKPESHDERARGMRARLDAAMTPGARERVALAEVQRMYVREAALIRMKDATIDDLRDEIAALRAAPEADERPEVVVLCGSTRFRDEMTEANRDLTLAGAIVLAPGVFGHSGDVMTDEQKVALDALHFRKIDLADRVLVVAPGGYIGSSTSREVTYAKTTGKPVEIRHEFAARRAAQTTTEQWSVMYDGGDFDRHHLPGPSDVEAYDTREATPEGDRYLTLRREVTGWEVVDRG